MSLSLADVDWGKLSPRSRDTLERIATPIAQDDKTHEQIAAELGITRREVSQRLDELAAEARAQVTGAELPDLTREEYEALRDHIREHGQLVPILFDRDGHLLDGRNRLRVTEELGLTPIMRLVDVDDARGAAIGVNVARRHLTTAAKRKLIEAELIYDSSRSDRAIAALLGVHNETVAAARRDLLERGEVTDSVTRRGRDGVHQPAKKTAIVTVTAPLDDQEAADIGAALERGDTPPAIDGRVEVDTPGAVTADDVTEPDHGFPEPPAVPPLVTAAAGGPKRLYVDERRYAALEQLEKAVRDYASLVADIPAIADALNALDALVLEKETAPDA